jgi:hypothetical protein
MEEGLGPSAAALLLLENALAKINTLAADVNVPRSFDQRANIAVARFSSRYSPLDAPHPNLFLRAWSLLLQSAA